MFKKILVPVDGSKYSINAGRKALSLAARHGGTVTFLHVINNTQIFSMGPSHEPPVVTETVIEGLKEGGNKILKRTLQFMDRNDVPIETELAWGLPAQVIVDRAREKPYDLIVIGSRGLGAIGGLLLGSVSDRVAKLASCPVMIVKE